MMILFHLFTEIYLWKDQCITSEEMLRMIALDSIAAERRNVWIYQ
jgi:hypothetical protein